MCDGRRLWRCPQQEHSPHLPQGQLSGSGTRAGTCSLATGWADIAPRSMGGGISQPCSPSQPHPSPPWEQPCTHSRLHELSPAPSPQGHAQPGWAWQLSPQSGPALIQPRALG